MKVKRLCACILACALSLSVNVPLSLADGLGAEFKSNSRFELTAGSTVEGFAKAELTTDSDGNNTAVKINFTSHSTARDMLVNYTNSKGDVADFAHVRFYVSEYEAITDRGEDPYYMGTRLIHYDKTAGSLRLNIDDEEGLSIYGDNGALRGYVVATDNPYLYGGNDNHPKNKIDYIADCNNGVIYMYINDVFCAYMTDGARDGRFYGFSETKQDAAYGEGDTYELSLDPSIGGHTLYNSTSNKKLTIDDVLSDIGIDPATISSERKRISESIATVTKENTYIHKQEAPFLISGPGKCIQFEEGSYTSKYDIIVDRNAADAKALKSNAEHKDVPDSTKKAHVQIDYTVEERASYAVWVRVYGATASSDSVYCSVDNGAYKELKITRGDYRWMNVYNSKMNPGEAHNVRMHTRENGAVIDCVVISRAPGYKPSGRYGDLPETLATTVDTLSATEYEAPPVNPPAKTHPRVLFRAEDIPRIKANMESPQSTKVMERFNTLLSDEIEYESSEYSVGTLSRIEANALKYALYGDKEAGSKAKIAIKGVLENVSLANLGASTAYRAPGHIIYVTAKVYDWCYDLITPDERQKMILDCATFASAMEIGWPPTGQGVLSGHGAEAQLLRDLLSISIAIYDERPDFWQLIGGRFYQYYVPLRNFYYSSMFQGSDYGLYREMWNGYAYQLIKGMGAEVPVDLDKLEQAGLWGIYYTRPDGQTIREGDISSGDKNAIWTYWSDFAQDFLNYGSLTGNPYFKLKFAKMSDANDHYTGHDPESSTVDFLIMNDPEVEPAKTFDGLPLSKYFGTPDGVSIARTGWDDGVDSPDVVAHMKVGEYQVNGHQHLDAGNFQIYYKGMLCMTSGVYQGYNNSTSGAGATAYGSEHFNAYQTKTIANNCMLVNDPSEFNGGSAVRSVTNDGGQRTVNGGAETGTRLTVEELKEGGFQTGEVVGQEIDPTNTQKPAYTYLKGDLTKAYSSKVTDYKRSFMFLNLDNSEVPAALIVFDKISSSNASFKKTWLLHGLEEPELRDNQIIYKRTYKSPVKAYGYNGKLTCDTLLPESHTYTKVGGEEMGWSNINGIDYPGYPFKSQTDEGQTWRVELSPKAQSLDDTFLNVLQVSDADKENYLPVEKLDLGAFYGVKISDRIVAFAKNGNRVEGGFILNTSGNGNFNYTICDVKAGGYSVSINGTKQAVYVSEEGGVLSFTAPSGTITVAPDETVAQANAEAPTTDVPTTDTVNLRVDNIFIYSPFATFIKNDTTVVDAVLLAKQTGVKSEVNGDTVKLFNKYHSVTFTVGSANATTDEGEIELNEAVFTVGDVIYVPLRSAIEALGGAVSWDYPANTVYVISPKRDLSLPPGYVKPVSVQNDGGSVDKDNVCDNLIDEDEDTIWASNGKGRYVIFTLDKVSTITGIDVMFNLNAGRDAAFAVEVSEDGRVFTQVYEGKGDGSVEGGAWEQYVFGSPYTVKYVKFVGNGSNISNWNAVKEIRIKGN